MSSDPFAGILDPFAWWDVAATYERYAGFFDLVVYCSLFIALAHSVLAGRFPGRPGKIMSTVLGIMLGTSIVLVEQRFGWSLGKASPIAALLALVVLGMLILHTLVRAHVSWILAAPLTYVIVYLFIRAVSPPLMAAISSRAPFVHLLAAVMFLICVWRIGVALWPADTFLRHHDLSDASFVSGLNRRREKDEFRLIKRMKKGVAPEAYRQTAKINADLESLQRELARPDPDLERVAQSSSHIAHQADDALHTIDRIRTLDRRIRNFDWHELQQLGTYYRELAENDRQKLKEQIQLERRKIVQEHAIDELASTCERRHRELRRALDRLGATASTHDLVGAREAISFCISLEQQQKADLKQLAKAEAKLLALTKKKLRKEKHM